jgi:hypothetical protein
MRYKDKRREARLPLCAWVSRHAPMPDQTRSLADYRIVQINSNDHYFRTHFEVWNAIRETCHGKPALIVAVLPKPMLVMLARFVKPIPVIRAQMTEGHDDARAQWTGAWKRVVDLMVIECEWSPEVEA